MTSLQYLILRLARELDQVFPFGHTSIGRLRYEVRTVNEPARPADGAIWSGWYKKRDDVGHFACLEAL